MKIKELKSRCRELENSLYRMRESIITIMRDYQARYEEFEDTVATLKAYVKAQELIVETYQISLAELGGVINYDN